MGKSILVIAEDPALRVTLSTLLVASGFSTARSTDKPLAVLLGCRERIAKNDLALARGAGQDRRRVPIILVTACGSEDLAVEALRGGVANYVRLPLTPQQLARAIGPFASDAGAPRCTDRILGESPAIRNIKAYLRRAAACSSNVLITGETGTGKELAAELVHRESARSEGPFISINCAAIPDSLLESELFGFERGAFTGATVAQDGKLKAAAGGTVFLDEIGDLSPCAQAKILRVIETREVQRLGARRSQPIDVRFVAATNKNLDSDSSFRRDLYFRLNVARIHLPPLRERKEDILPLAEAFRTEFDPKFGSVSRGFLPGARELLLRHDWPGNIRELRNIIEAAFIDPGPDVDGYIDLPRQFRKALQTACGGELERILLALAGSEWNRSRAAKSLHWSRMTLYRKMARYGIAQAAAS
jgi:DNA-binding NtrC family response regulator